MRNFLLSAVLITVPVAGFTLVDLALPPSSAAPADQVHASPGLGDLSDYEAIVADTQKIAATGDLSAAETRITDLETLWDDNAGRLRKAAPNAWGAVDEAADAAFSALRADTPDAAQVEKALTALMTTLKAPTPLVASGPVRTVAGIPVTDEAGRPLPCETMLSDLRDGIGKATPPNAVADLQAKALERCNADDDARADAFSAQALSLLVKG
ncbi:hypothetical protein [Rhodospirillum sp. A1_3_36]|uniref:hypothetical protein n=1 Tax=Rhodospirillum sp. A1_3_36 TaxID=3391666 RepID=UPI0039A4E4CC